MWLIVGEALLLSGVGGVLGALVGWLLLTALNGLPAFSSMVVAEFSLPTFLRGGVVAGHGAWWRRGCPLPGPPACRRSRRCATRAASAARGRSRRGRRGCRRRRAISCADAAARRGRRAASRSAS
ncbi:MAG: ABC transporter permease [Anaerolineae bacterium]